MSGVQIAMVCLFALLAAMIVGLGLFSQRPARDYLDWRPTRSPEAEAADAADDVEDMLRAANALRRRRGAPERTGADVAADVRRDRDELARRRQEWDAWHGS